ncbi:MAG TPA: PilZ domain-containing protein [Chromatiales bacterium]|nr:PilZ domain-containing protein [Chromatiales bacterium]
MDTEQRRFPRTPINEETIYFSHPDKENKSERTYSPAVITDISRGGVGMQVGIPHEIDDELWLEGLEGFTVAQPARVKWVKEHNDSDDTFSIGVEFGSV